MSSTEIKDIVDVVDAFVTHRIVFDFMLAQVSANELLVWIHSDWYEEIDYPKHEGRRQDSLSQLSIVGECQSQF